MNVPTYDEIKPYIEKKLVSEQVHPQAQNLRIFNYTQSCQFAQAWDDVTRQCRGLIMDVVTGEVIARPFPKFFNYGEHVSKGWPIPTSTPIVTDKLDGSLGILYELNGEPWIATRGSFSSDQAIWATEWWRKSTAMLPSKDHTNLFEIIYPENRIVVSYDYSGLVHLATLKTSTGEQIPYSWHPVRSAERIEVTDLARLAEMDTPNSEGFVLFFPEENVRMKIKFPEYVRLHKLVTGINEIAIWEHLRDGKTLDDLIQKVPDEFFQWVTSTANKLNDKYNAIYEQAERDFNEVWQSVDMDIELVRQRAEYRKAFAIAAQKKENSGVLFALLDNKPFSPIIWKMVRPHGAKVFKVDIDL